VGTPEIEVEVDGEAVRIAAEIDVTVLCERYGSQMDRFPEGLVESLAKPTTLRGGKEAFLAFRYGSKKYKVTFEQIDRLRIPKEAKGDV
jgi:hypothetical protein